MKKIYLLSFLFLFTTVSIAQPCTSLDFTYTVSESRCVATGTITVNVTGGSGNYNYKATGPVTTPSTSSNIISGLAPGSYSILVKDMTTGCSKQIDNVQVPGNYADPRFQLTKTDAGCSGNDGTVSVLNQQFGRSPFLYSIVAPSPSNIGVSNTNGNFTGLTPGEYTIRLLDSCGGIQVRMITIENYNWWFDSVGVSRIGCDSLSAFIRLKDNKGNLNTSGSAFSGFTYGYVFGTDTTWSATNNFKLFIGKQRRLTIVVKDNCGNVHSYVWNFPAAQKPTVGSVSLSSLACSTLTATVGGSNLTTPQYCLYQSGILIYCNSTGVFSNLVYGSYCIEVKDPCYDTTFVRCFTATKPLPAVGATVNITNKGCDGFTATISGQQNLYTPQYCLYDVTHTVIGCNSTGVFNNVPYGTYCIETFDACTDSIISRCFTVTPPVPVLTSATVSNATCDSFRVTAGGSGLISPTYCLYDSLGNVIVCNSTGIFNVIGYGNYCVRAISCGITTNAVCITANKPTPSVGAAVAISNKQCSTFTATITGQYYLVNPQYCLYNAVDTLITCNSTGVFPGLAYGSYCIKVKDGCVDTTIVRCFAQSRNIPAVSSTFQMLSSNCSTVSFKINGTNLTAPTYCLFDANEVLVGCNSTGIFDDVPYGQYCVDVHDGCVDTTIRVCKTFTPTKGLTVSTSKACTIGNANISVSFTNSNIPFNVRIYHPDGTLLRDVITSSNPFTVQMPYLPTGAQYKVVGTDSCGNKDSALIAPDANVLTRNVVVRAKCPSATWLNGAGDLNVTSSSNHYTVIPQVIKKNNVSFVKSFSSVASSVYTFSDLEPATYVVEYTQQTCNTKVYDTVTVPPYAYPTQGESAIYQCDNNGFSLGADVAGGVSPYTYQIIGSTPSSPSIVSGTQVSPVFYINNGTTYSLVRVRTLDACGNATLADVSVLPLQNISVSASNTCFFTNVVLSVDTVPNAVYTWYRKNTPTDSVLIGTGLTYNLPFFVPEQIGDYICKMVLNDGCVTRLAHFILDGNCGDHFLPATLKLQGKKDGNKNQLHWSNTDEKDLLKYIVERKRANETNYSAIGTINVHQGKKYVYSDESPSSGMNHYRLKLVYASKTEYSNIVSLKAATQSITVYPNPAKEKVNITINGDKTAQYRIEILSAAGEIVYSTEVKNITSATIVYARRNNLPTGMYLVRIKNIDANTTEIRKLLFE